MSVAFREIHRAQHRRRLRESTDLELIIAGRMLRDLVASAKTIVSVDGDRGEKFQVQLDDAIEEWRARQSSRRAGNLCLCHMPGSQSITGNARTWRASGYDRWLERRLGL